MDIQVNDIVALQRETSQIEFDLRLRAIVAERRIKELEAEIAAMKAQKEHVA